MIGRADIEESKSNVAMNAWLPQASYPCGNFSVTSGINILIISVIKGSLALLSQSRFVLKISNQASLYACVLREISVLTELALGHLRYCVTDMPPQPNSPSGRCLETKCTQEYRKAPKLIARKGKLQTQEGPNPEAQCTNRINHLPVIIRLVKPTQKWWYFIGGLHLPPILHLSLGCTSQTGVKLNRVFFPR